MTTHDLAAPEPAEPAPAESVPAGPEPAVAGPTGVVLAALRLQPDPGDPDQFTGTSLPQPHGRVFGGQVLAQALLAAGATVDDGRLPHSLHGYFLRAGVIDEPITFAVERLRDGRSFTARRTHALQQGVPILSMIASFQVEQEGVEYAEEMPRGVPDPEDVRSVFDVLGPIDHPVARFWSHESAFDVRHVEGALYLGPAPERTGRQMAWIRARSPLPDDQLLHRALLAFACDQVMLEPVLRRAGRSWVTPGMAIASLDHAMWWHRDVRVDDWLLYVQSTPSAQGGRGLGAARVFTRDGTLVASIAQEGMVRLP
ncbi:acyl-CoA thioesterase [Cellulomonas persica]|nr:acyl-CoA thioesterase II [Cellulomonas persica]